MSIIGAIRDAVTGLTAAVTARTQTPSGNALQVQIGPGDIISNLPVVIEYDHHQLHEGEAFRWSVYVSNLTNGTNKDIQLVVPNISMGELNPVAKCPHFRFEFVSGVGGNGYLYEAPTISVAGTDRTPIALERNGTYTPKLVIKEDPTVSAVGTLIWQSLLTAGKQVAGSVDSTMNEFVLKNNTTYLLRFTSSGNTNPVLVRMVWYEDLGV